MLDSYSLAFVPLSFFCWCSAVGIDFYWLIMNLIQKTTKRSNNKRTLHCILFYVFNFFIFQLLLIFNLMRALSAHVAMTTPSNKRIANVQNPKTHSLESFGLVRFNYTNNETIFSIYCNGHCEMTFQRNVVFCIV